MPRAKKDGKFANYYLRKDIIDRVDAYSEATSIPKTSIVEVALQEYLDKVEQRHQKAV